MRDISIMDIPYIREDNIFDSYYNVVKYGCVIEAFANPIIHIWPKRTNNIKNSGYIKLSLFI